MGKVLRWALMLPVALVAYLVVAALTALIGAWYVTGGVLALIVSLVTATIPYWILLHIFDAGAVIYFAQALFATAAAMWAGTYVAPRPRTAVGWMFGTFLFLAGTIAVAALYETAQFSDARPYWQVIVGLVIQTCTAWYVLTAVRSAAAAEVPSQAAATQPAVADLVASLEESIAKAKALESQAHRE